MDNSYNASTDTFGLPATLPDFSGLHVVVIGDVMLDRTVSGSTERVSPEAPVPVVAFEGERNTPGGAANVALGVAALGARCTLLGLVGEDAEADTLERLCAEAGVQVDFIRVPGVPTTLKMRMQSRGQQLLRIDREAAMPAAAAKQLADRLEARLAHADALLVSDYDKGAIATPATVLAAARQHDIPVVVDPKHKPLASWRGATVVKPNRAEFERLTMAGGGPTVGLAARVAAARRQTGIDNLLVTLGGAGAVLAAADGAVTTLAAHDVDVFDVTGAGDSVAAVLATALAAGVELATAAALANLAGAEAVGHVGTVAVGRARLAARLRAARTAPGRIVDIDALAERVSAARARGERLVFTNGCFDLLHAGHVGYLQQAATLGDRLIVAINDDASVARLKGPGRPLNVAADRASVLAGLAAVDWVVTFAEDTPLALLERLRPDVLVKGGDYALEDVVGADLVRGWGGQVHVLRHIDSPSTSELISRTRR